MSTSVDVLGLSGDGLPICQGCGTTFHKPNAKFCRHCGASRELSNSLDSNWSPPITKSGDKRKPASGNAPPDQNPSSAESTLRPLEAGRKAQLQAKSEGKVPALSGDALEFRDPGAPTSLSTPHRQRLAATARAGGGTSGSIPPPIAPLISGGRGKAATARAPGKSAIYTKDGTLPDLPSSTMADPRRSDRVQTMDASSSSSSEGTGAQLAATAVPQLSGSAGALVPTPPPGSPNRPSSASAASPFLSTESSNNKKKGKKSTTSNGTSNSTTDTAASSAQTWEREEGEEKTGGATRLDAHVAATAVDEDYADSFTSLHPSEAEEAQYNAWATLPPEGLTPDMLQTGNAGELRRWRKGSLIGRGTYGSVYLGLLPDGSFHAVKCVELSNRRAASDHLGAQELVSLSREINMMHRLRHPNLCNFKGVYYDAESTSICMFMEYIGGGSLSSLVKRFKPLPPSVVRSWTRQLLTGLVFLHAQNIIHRDIKGDNVLVDTSADPASMAQIKLVDFGAARRLTDAVSQSSTVIGTPYWMAPEVVDASGDGAGYSYKADVWSVGCTVAEMLTGKPPWPCKASAPAAIMMIANATGMPTEVPEEEATAGCLDLMRQCFIRNPAARPTAQALLQHPWVKGEME